MRVLIVEDCFIQSTVLSKILESENFDVTGICRSSSDVMNSLENTIPDLILMDVFLNGDLNGYQIMQIIREKYDVPVIFVTAIKQNDLYESVKAMEKSFVLGKPISKPDLITAIQELMGSTAEC
jgi:CheY-like chemotaxis protein